MPSTTLECIAVIVASKWSPPYAIEGDWKLQYELTEPLIDTETRVKVTFSGGVAVAELGAHDDPDVTFTMSGQDFIRHATDEMYTTMQIALGKVKIKMNKPSAQSFIRRLGQSYRSRP